jgi:hypothetical protein
MTYGLKRRIEVNIDGDVVFAIIEQTCIRCEAASSIVVCVTHSGQRDIGAFTDTSVERCALFRYGTGAHKSKRNKRDKIPRHF